MNVGELENVKACVFAWNRGQDDTLIVESEKTDYIVFLKKYGQKGNAKRADGLEFDGSGKLWFAVFVQDCFDPPICIVRADNASDAEEIFTSEKDWADVSETDAKDFDEEQLQATERGTMYDPENVSVREVFLLRVECGA